MPQTPKPRVLPRVTYEPPTRGAAMRDWLAGVGGSVNQAAFNISNPYGDVAQTGAPIAQAAGGFGYDLANTLADNPTNPGWWQNPVDGATPPSVVQDRTRDPNYQNSQFNFPPPSITQQAQGMGKPIFPPGRGGASDPRDAPVNPPLPTTTNPKTADQIAAEVAANAAATNAAINSGNAGEVSRLQREWEQLKASPVYQQFFAGNDEQANKEHLVNIYMKPDRANAATSFADAAVLAAKDKIWADEARAAGLFTNDAARNQLLWEEHYNAMNFGGRDPLDGHPQAIQNIQARAADLNNSNSTANYGKYSDWLMGK